MQSSLHHPSQTAVTTNGHGVNAIDGHDNGKVAAPVPKPLPIPTTFNPKTYVPDMRYSGPVIKERLGRSILHEFSEVEAKARIELAAVYRLYGRFDWTESIYNHTTVRIHNGNGGHHYLINPLGLNYEEITASSLIKVDLEGNVVHPGVVGDLFGVNKAGLVIHSAVHAARDDVEAVSHTHHIAAAGISATKDGILQLTQTVNLLGPLSYHDYEGIAVNKAEQERLVKDLGQTNVLILKNHGILTVGASLAQAFYLMYLTAKSCEMQTHALASAKSKDDLLIVPQKQVQENWEIGKKFTDQTTGVLEFCAFMRLLDSEDPSYRN